MYNTQAFALLDKLRAKGEHNEDVLRAEVQKALGCARLDAIQHFADWHCVRSQEAIVAAPKSVFEWTPGNWWAVAQTGPDGSYTPLYQGKGDTTEARKSDATRWLDNMLDQCAKLLGIPMK